MDIWNVWKKYEGRRKRRCGEVKTDEVRKLDEGPRVEVDGLSTPPLSVSIIYVWQIALQYLSGRGQDWLGLVPVCASPTVSQEPPTSPLPVPVWWDSGQVTDQGDIHTIRLWLGNNIRLLYVCIVCVYCAKIPHPFFCETRRLVLPYNSKEMTISIFDDFPCYIIRMR